MVLKPDISKDESEVAYLRSQLDIMRTALNGRQVVLESLATRLRQALEREETLRKINEELQAAVDSYRK